MSLNEETEFTVQDVADLLPTGTVDPAVAQADPTSVEASGARHQRPPRSASNTTTSAICATRARSWEI